MPWLLGEARRAAGPRVRWQVKTHMAPGSDQNTFRPVQPRRALDDVILQIEESILEHRLAVGERLPPERDLAEAFQVSRSVVREALRVLEAFGVLTARRGAGARTGTIVGISTKNGLSSLLPLYVAVRRVPLGDLVDIRVAIEVMSARAAAAAATGDQRDHTERIIAAMGRATEIPDFLALDTEFHVTVARLSGNSIAPFIMDALREAMARQMLRAFEVLENWQSERDALVAEHAEIADLICSGDAEAAGQAMEQHIRGFYARVLARSSDAPGRATIGGTRKRPRLA
jgi:GntR family transcriptional regulator, transcriptional repressor for pyruvate dehydrogenase complex